MTGLKLCVLSYPSARYTLKTDLMRIHSILALLFAAAIACSAAPQSPGSAKQEVAPPAKTAAVASRPNAPLLPPSFAGWEATTQASPATDATQIDSASAAALREYGFTDGVTNDYSRDGQTLKLKALRFVDASGAYGAYSFYRHSGWPKAEIGAGAASDNNRVLFWKGNIVVDALFPRITAMSGSEMRSLADTLPLPAGNKSLAPPILSSLPQKNLDGQTTHYAFGTAGYTGSGGVLPPDLVGFDKGAEVVTATYSLGSGPATLTLINYPTPQMAAAQEKAISDYLKTGNSPQHPFTKPLQDSNPTVLEARRSGPLVVVVSGDPIQDDSRKLIGLVHYEADTSSIPGGFVNPVQNFARLIVGIIVLVVVMFIAAIFVAAFLGGGRAAFRILRGKPASSMYDDEFTRLDLK
jgi:hypothetical protein